MTGVAKCVLAVFDDQAQVEQVREELLSTGVERAAISIDEAWAVRASLEAEMADEVNHSLAGPGVAPIPREVARGSAYAMTACCLLALVIALPCAAVPFAGLAWWWRLCVLAAAGLATGAMAGFIIGGGILARGGPARPADANRGVVVAVASSEQAVIQTLQHARPIRIDVVSEYGAPLWTVATEADFDGRGVVQGVADDLHRNPDDRSRWAAR